MTTLFQFRTCLLFLALLVLASCQTLDTEGGLKVEEPVTSVAGIETIGTGKTQIHMVLNRSGSLSNSAERLDYRNGAALAIQDLGQELVTLTVINGESSLDATESKLSSATSKGSKLIITGSDINTRTAAANIVADQNTPVIALSQSASEYGYGFLPSSLDSLGAGMGYALDQGKQKIAIFVPSDIAAPTVQALKRRHAGRNFSLLEIPLSAKANLKSIVKQNAASLQEANAIIFAGTDIEVARSVRATKALLGGSDSRIYFARYDLPSSVLANSSMDGVLIATPDTSSNALISDRFQSSFGRPMPLSAAYAYDIVAIAAGLVRAKGENGISKANLETPSGFRAATGAFRLRPDDRVERLYQISKLRNGKTTVVRNPLKTF